MIMMKNVNNIVKLVVIVENEILKDLLLFKDKVF